MVERTSLESENYQQGTVPDTGKKRYKQLSKNMSSVDYDMMKHQPNKRAFRRTMSQNLRLKATFMDSFFTKTMSKEQGGYNEEFDSM